jgi:hypothetical protein
MISRESDFILHEIKILGGTKHLPIVVADHFAAFSAKEIKLLVVDFHSHDLLLMLVLHNVLIARLEVVLTSHDVGPRLGIGYVAVELVRLVDLVKHFLNTLLHDAIDIL